MHVAVRTTEQMAAHRSRAAVADLAGGLVLVRRQRVPGGEVVKVLLKDVL
jgi:hypothetical protein